MASKSIRIGRLVSKAPKLDRPPSASLPNPVFPRFPRSELKRLGEGSPDGDIVGTGGDERGDFALSVMGGESARSMSGDWS